ncbi:aldo/keto reductase [Epibacterium ulvae]|uniref:Predicted oxidoreductase n=1 Tax=Epibacterium ulvae TaxID=1156985 RepID=A0A1G5PNP8_9RHOB|nr:aldo/keto reductase [Epibacterium ulvae]SCZ51078.1 Predicted oxidoreductase [Epibacterium ulvae]
MTAVLTTPSGASHGQYVFGTMQFGGRADATASREMFEACRTAGLRHFDTAWLYTDGQSETLLGEMIASCREDILLATKVGYSGGAGPANLDAQFETSRQRLNQDSVDLLYLHQFDPDTDLRATLGWFAEQKLKNRIRYVGLSNFAAWQVVKAAWAASELDLKIDVLQPMYSLVKRQAEVEILPMCKDLDITPIPYSPLGGGLLTGKYAKGESGRLTEDKRYAARYGQSWMYDCAKNLTKVAEREGVNPATLAVAWAAAHESNPTPILSARSEEQLRPSLKAAHYALTPALYEELAALSPRPAPATDRLEETTE